MKRIEDGLQRGVIELLAVAGVTDLWWYAVPNGGWRSPAEARILKGLGVRAGVHDIMLCIPPNGRMAGLELKAPRGRMSDKQHGAHADLSAAGGLSDTVWSLEEAYRILLEWGAIERDRVKIK